MIRTPHLARRTSLTVAMAGAVAFGAVALAPAASASTGASAAVDGSYTVVDGPSENGPDSFLLDGTGRKPVFFCDDDKPHQRHNNCQDDPSGGGRF